MTFDLVLPTICERDMGYTVKAQERKRQEGVWLEGFEYVRAPDGHILVSKTGVQRWAAGLPRVALSQQATGSKSGSPTEAESVDQLWRSSRRKRTSSTQHE